MNNKAFPTVSPLVAASNARRDARRAALTGHVAKLKAEAQARCGAGQHTMVNKSLTCIVCGISAEELL